MTAAESLPSEASVASGVSASGAESVRKAQQVAQDETSRDEKNDVGAEMEEKDESSSDTQARPNHADREAFPTTFDDLCGQMTERANFLLEVIRLTYVDRCIPLYRSDQSWSVTLLERDAHLDTPLLFLFHAITC